MSSSESDNSDVESDVVKQECHVVNEDAASPLIPPESAKSRVGYEFGGYTVLPDVTKTKKTTVRRKLPAWLELPDVVHADIANKKKPVDEIGCISTETKQRLAQNNITHLFPVQWQVIPAVVETVLPGSIVSKLGLAPRDICCSAPTGSGKTLAFVLPLVQILQSCVTRKLRALVVLPVADLALQVYKVFQNYCRGTCLRVGLCNGQMSFTAEQSLLCATNQVSGDWESCVDILVSTPGRLVDHISFTPGFDLSNLRFLVLDEVDRILEEVKHDWLTCLERAVYDKRGWPQPLTAAGLKQSTQPLQKLIFSATLTENPEKLEKLNLCEPRLFTSIVKSVNRSTDNLSHDETTSHHFVGKYTTPHGLQEYYTECNVPSQKPLALLYMLHTLRLRKVLVFTGSQKTCEKLHSLLVQYSSDPTIEQITGSMTKKRRTKIITQFMNGRIDVLITTDLMARGMDIDDVSAVISYDSPPYIKTYIHRVGRTARAGKQGISYTILNTKEVSHFRKMMKSAGKSVKAKKVTRSDLKPYTAKCQQILHMLSKRAGS